MWQASCLEESLLKQTASLILNTGSAAGVSQHVARLPPGGCHPAQRQCGSPGGCHSSSGPPAGGLPAGAVAGPAAAGGQGGHAWQLAWLGSCCKSIKAVVSVALLQAQALDLPAQIVKVHACVLPGGGTAMHASWRRLKASQDGQGTTAWHQTCWRALSVSLWTCWALAGCREQHRWCCPCCSSTSR